MFKANTFDHGDLVSKVTNENIIESISMCAKNFSRVMRILTKIMGTMFLPMSNTIDNKLQKFVTLNIEVRTINEKNSSYPNKSKGIQHYNRI